MGKPRPTQEQFKAYEAMYRHFNRILFGARLPPVILNFSRHSGTYGFFAPERWGRVRGRGKRVTHEISINPSHLALRDPRDTAATLLHEMCHLWQQDFGDPPRRGYHDREWAAKMREVGLIPIDPHTGQERNSAHALAHRIDPEGRFAQVFRKMPREYLLPWKCGEVSRVNGGRGRGGAGGEGSKSRNKVKYSCSGCGANAWGKPDLDLVCGRCSLRFAEARS